VYIYINVDYREEMIMSDCKNLEKCGFVKKYGESKALAVKGFVAMYCMSEKQEECKKERVQTKKWSPTNR
jgi:hypothetical protein